MDLIKHIGTNKQTSNFFSNVGDNALVQYYQQSQRTRFLNRELSSTVSSGGIHGNGFMSTSNIAATMATGVSQQTLHPSSSASSFQRSSLKIELHSPTAKKFYPTLSLK
jgi:hypothetical protein